MDHLSGGSDHVDAIDQRLFVGSVQKAMVVMEAFDRDHRAMSISDLAKRTELGRSATQRFVYTLEKIGYLTRDPESRTYRLSNRSFRFVQSILSANTALNQSLHLLAKLSEQTEETVSWVERDGREIVVVHSLPSPHRTAIKLPVGSRFEGLTASSGMLFLAESPLEEVRRTFDTADAASRQRLEMQSFDAYMARIRDFSAKGYAMTEKDVDVSSMSLSAPVRDVRGKMIAGINVSILRERVSMKDVQTKILPQLVEAAESAGSFVLG